MEYIDELTPGNSSGAIHCMKAPTDTPLFRRLLVEEMETLNRSRIQLSFRKGEIINKQGAFASNIFFIKQGIVKTYLENGNSNLIIAIVPAGSLIGLQSISVDNVFHYSTKALIDTDIYSYDINVVKNLMNQNGLFASEMTNIINHNMVMLYDRFFSLTQKQLHGRLADIILCLSHKIYKSLDFELCISRKDLAELTGMSTESAIRILKDFKDDHIIDMSGKRMKILEVDKLKRISATG
ncbi:MAG: Crp/Fnr family transcriptional regulator [Bacteroidales bacterium]|nr:Crp/Fnr family transcriptional regulator [Bacteroidales bacterium]